MWVENEKAVRAVHEHGVPMAVSTARSLLPGTCAGLSHSPFQEKI